MSDKTCPRCKETKPLTPEFWYRLTSSKQGFQAYCKPCKNALSRPHREKGWEVARAKRRTPKGRISRIIQETRSRCKKSGLPFDLTPEDLSIPEVCPVLGIPIRLDNSRISDTSPSLDRLIPEKGYVKGNVAVISQRANVIKNCGTAAEHEAIARWMREQGSK